LYSSTYSPQLKALKPQTLLKNTRFKVPSTAQNTSSKSIITTREPDQEPSANIPDQSETNAMAQNTQDTTAEDTTAQNITSTLDALHLDPPITPPETVESLRAYEKGPGEAQKFLGTTKICFTHAYYYIFCFPNRCLCRSHGTWLHVARFDA